MRLALLVILAAAAARAQNSVTDPGAPWPTTIDMPRSTAMGGAHAAIASSNDAVVVNPAGISQSRRYHFELDGVYDSKFPAQGVMASIVDSVGTAAGSGMLFSRWGSGQPGGRGEGWLVGFSYSSIAGQGFYYGGTTKYTRFRGPDGFTARWAQDVGVLSKHGGFSWAAVVQNITTQAIPLFPLTGTLGMAWGTDTDWHLAFDYKADFSGPTIKHRANTGAEMLIDQTLALRGGASYDATEHQWSISAGAGILTERGGFQLVWRRRVHGGPYDQFFEAGLTVYLE